MRSLICWLSDTITFGIRGNSSDDLVNGILGPLFTNVLNGVFTSFGLTFGLAMLLAEVVTERVTKFKHQIRLTGCRAPIYWLSQLTTDFVYFFILAVIVFVASLIAIKSEFGCSAGFVRDVAILDDSSFFQCVASVVYVLPRGFFGFLRSLIPF